MPNRLSPGCCCGCDIFQADFDLRYMLPTIPTTTSDWTSAQVRPFPGARRMAIIKDAMGEGLVFTQTVGGTITQASPRRQTLIPELTDHPDPAPIRALPGFALYVYRILPNEGGPAAGFYSLTPTTRTGPTTTRPVSMGVEIDWTTYWRRHFVLLDSAGVEVPGPDRFPFRLEPGERLESMASMPAKWFSLVFTNLFYPGWRTDPASVAKFSLIDPDGAELVSILLDSTTIESTRHARCRITKDGEDVHDLLHVPVAFGAFHNQLANLQWLFRNDHFETWVGNEDGFISTAQQAGIDPTVLRWRIMPNPWVLDPENVFKKTGVPYVFLGEFEPARLRIEVSGNERRFGVAAAERAQGNRPKKEIIDDVETMTVEEINPTCPARKTNPAVWPFHKTRWNLERFALPGLVSPMLEQFTHSRQEGVFLSVDDPDVPKTYTAATVEVPAGRYSGSNVWLREGEWRSSTPETQSYKLSLSPVRLAAIVLETPDPETLEIRIQCDAYYLRPLIETAAGPVSFSQELALPSQLGGSWIDYAIDPTAPNTQGFQDVGWATLKLSPDWLPFLEPVTFFWSKLIDRFEGDDFEIDLDGSDATITNVTGETVSMIESRTVSAAQIGTTAQYTVTTTGANQVFNLRNLQIKLTGPDAL